MENTRMNLNKHGIKAGDTVIIDAHIAGGLEVKVTDMSNNVMAQVEFEGRVWWVMINRLTLKK